MSVDSGNDDGRYITVSDVSVPYWLKSIYDQDEYYYIHIGQSTSNAIELSDGDTITVSISINDYQSSRYLSWKGIYFEVVSSYGDTIDSCDTGDGEGSYDASTSTFTYTTTVDNVGEYCWVNLQLIGPTVTSSSLNETFIIGCTDFEIVVESEQTGFFNSVKEFFQELFEKLTSAFDNIGAWFSELGDKIKSFFTDLTDNIKSFFSDLSGNLKEWFNNIGDWFTEIGDKISGFFEKLWNRIWWGNENGESEYQKPVIDNKLNDILDTLDDYQLQLKNTIDTIGSAADEVSTYISTGTQLVNGVIGVAGVGFTALIVFGIVFVLVRKVVGR